MFFQPLRTAEKNKATSSEHEGEMAGQSKKFRVCHVPIPLQQQGEFRFEKLDGHTAWMCVCGYKSLTDA